jgi:uncharacterized protein YfaS (alpha-2-macroglobulin family)
LVDSGNRNLGMLARRDGNDLMDERTSAFAIYLLARQGIVVGNELVALQRRLNDHYPNRWTTDIAAGYMAATYEIMKQHDLAMERLTPLLHGVKAGDDRWDDAMVSDARLLYLVSRHFPDRLSRLPVSLLPSLADRVAGGQYQALSAATTILALDAYAQAMPKQVTTAFSIAALLADKSEQTLSLPVGLFPQVDFPSTASALHFKNDSSLQGFYALEESGFDRRPPAEAQSQGLEVIREYFSSTGQPLTTVKVGEEIVVRVRFRAIGRPAIEDLVIVDLLPGGFDLSMPPPVSGDGPLLSASVGNMPEEESSGNRLPESERCGCGFLWQRPAAFPDYADMREDRVVLYGRATDSVQEFSYRIKATNAGAYLSPPAYGESMYDPTIRARSTASRLTVTNP